MKQIYSYLITVLLMASFSASSQTIINTYGQVTAMSGTTLTIANATGTFTTGQAIIMQMQDSVIGANTGNNSSFGNIDIIRTAGKSEVVSITAVSGTTITIASATINTFHFGVNARVQLISYPTLGGGNYTLSSSITATSWNGNVGGVVAFNVAGTLILNNNISVNGQGFRGGAVGANAPGDVSCDPNTYYNGAGGVSTTYYGLKGEGIYNSNSVYTVARGKLANGAGGGNVNNSGGGGGGNFTTGGLGGLGWTCTASTTGAGVGGADLSTYISSTRFFLGGGGGGAQQNNNVGSAGGNGGGIVMIKANAIQTQSGCTGGAISITANGINAGNSGNDGAGGGGAGGSVMLDAAAYTINNGCPLTVSANGANGGSVNDPGVHGGGAGGGKGVVIFTQQSSTPSNLTAINSNGTGGSNSNASGSSVAGSGSGTASSGTSGVILGGFSVLPVKLTNFIVSGDSKIAVINWNTAEETNFAYFIVERSTDNGTSFSAIGSLQAKGNNSAYHMTDNLGIVRNNGVLYYRLKMVDVDGRYQYSDIRILRLTATPLSVKAYPVPAQAFVNIVVDAPASISSLQVYVNDMQGRLMKNAGTIQIGQSKSVTVSLEGLSAGQYIIVLGNNQYKDRVVITKQ